MLLTYTNTDQTVDSNANILFNTVGIQTGCTATHDAGTSVINLNKCGIYMVEFNGNAAILDTPDVISVQLYANGNIVTGANASASGTDTTNTVNLNFTTLVRVLPNCQAVISNIPTALTFQNTGVSAIFSNANVVVTKIG